QEEHAAEAVEGSGQETILVVEDDRDVRLYLAEALRDLNYRVLSAHDAVSALGLINEGDVRIDLLLTDVVLPGMNGRQLAEQARNRRPGFKVLFTTGYSQNAIVPQGRLDPVVAMIQKPIARDNLAARARWRIPRLTNCHADPLSAFRNGFQYQQGRPFAGMTAKERQKAPRPPECLGQSLEFSLHGRGGVPDILHRFGQPLLRYAEFVGPILNFVRF